MWLLKRISRVNKKVPKTARFIISLIILNIPPVIYLTLAGPQIAPIYVAIIFLLINIAALIAYFKIEEVEVESPIGKVRVKK